MTNEQIQEKVDELQATLNKSVKIIQELNNVDISFQLYITDHVSSTWKYDFLPYKKESSNLKFTIKDIHQTKSFSVDPEKAEGW